MGENTVTVLIYAGTIVLTIFFFALMFVYGWRLSQREKAVSPYTGVPLRRTTEISYYSSEKILRYLYDLHQYDNRIFRLRKAAFCRETGRIFQDCVTIFDTIKIDWNFLQKRFKGIWVSWGSLPRELQDEIRKVHTSLDRFQTIDSSPSPSPRALEPTFAYTKPGPLYVDLETKVLLGWQVVPDTEFEVLIVQKPIK